MPNTLNRTTDEAQRVARDFVDRYFTALATEIPSGAPGNVNLIDAMLAVEEALPLGPDPDDKQDLASRAGYILGVEIGRRMAGGGR